MTDPTRGEFSAVIGMLTEGQAELRTDMRELTNSVNTSVQTLTKYMESQRHTEAEIEDLKHDVNGFKEDIEPRVRTLEVEQGQDRIRWYLLAATATFLVTLSGGVYKLIVEPSIAASTSNAQATDAIHEQTEINKRILELLDGN
jgi:hypothetical protein